MDNQEWVSRENDAQRLHETPSDSGDWHLALAVLDEPFPHVSRPNLTEGWRRHSSPPVATRHLVKRQQHELEHSQLFQHTAPVVVLPPSEPLGGTPRHELLRIPARQMSSSSSTSSCSASSLAEKPGTAHQQVWKKDKTRIIRKDPALFSTADVLPLRRLEADETSVTSSSKRRQRDQNDTLRSQISERMDPTLLDAQDILDNAISTATELICPIEKKRRRVNYRKMDQEEAKIARKEGLERRAEQKAKRERLRRVLQNEFLEILQRHFRLEDDSIDQLKILSCCISLVRNLEASHRPVYEELVSYPSGGRNDSDEFSLLHSISNTSPLPGTAVSSSVQELSHHTHSSSVENVHETHDLTINF